MFGGLNIMSIKILYEDSSILVIDKPSGVFVHPTVNSGTDSNKNKKEETISDWFLKKYPKAKKVGEPLRIRNSLVESNQVHKVESELTIDRPGIVHRLDKETSGVLHLVKNQKAYEFLKN